MERKPLTTGVGGLGSLYAEGHGALLWVLGVGACIRKSWGALGSPLCASLQG